MSPTHRNRHPCNQLDNCNRLRKLVTAMNEDVLRQVVCAAVLEVAPEAELEKLDPAVSFHDQIDFDSVDYLNLMLRLEAALGIHIPEGAYTRLSSLEGCLAYLGPLVADQARPSDTVQPKPN